VLLFFHIKICSSFVVDIDVTNWIFAQVQICLISHGRKKMWILCNKL